MENYSKNRTIIGFLDNLFFYEGAKKLAEKHHVESRLIRKDMIKAIEELFQAAGIHYIGPNSSDQHSVGSYLFKMRVPDTEKDLQKFTLEKLNVDSSLKLPFGYIDSDVPLGFLIKEFSDDKWPGEISYCEDSVLNLASHAAAFCRQRRERGKGKAEPYFLEIDGGFEQKFPIDPDLDHD